MKGNLTGLVDLQKVDKELQALEALKGDLPQQVGKLRNELNVAKETYGSQRNELTEIKKTKALREVELQDFQEKAKKYREQLYAVTSNREYDAITTEIDAVDAKISDVEDEVLQFIEDEEILEQELANAEPEITALEENLDKTEKELNEKIQATEKEYEAFRRQRDEISESVERRVLYQYERIRKGIGNSVVAEIMNNACGSCFSSIPPQKQLEVRTMTQLIFCESCGRILVYTRKREAVAS
ncbi:MAG: C4-type zinc ribbon domain-containing protein [Calditrichaeota bacterium]|nr:C4-type zinc ribbon domain-containing protein [Calditrichota bacterium]